MRPVARNTSHQQAVKPAPSVNILIHTIWVSLVRVPPAHRGQYSINRADEKRQLLVRLTHKLRAKRTLKANTQEAEFGVFDLTWLLLLRTLCFSHVICKRYYRFQQGPIVSGLANQRPGLWAVLLKPLYCCAECVWVSDRGTMNIRCVTRLYE